MVEVSRISPRALFLSAFVIALVGASTLVSGQAPACTNTCALRIDDKKQHAGHGHNPSDVLKIDVANGFQWTIEHHKKGTRLYVEIRQFDFAALPLGICPGRFKVDGNYSPPAGRSCGAALTFDQDDQSHLVTLEDAWDGTYKFKIVIKGDPKESENKADIIDPQLEIDTGGGLLHNLIAAILALFAALVLGGWFAVRRFRRRKP